MGETAGVAFPRVGDRFGPYQVESVLGEGGMGVVFGAVEVSLGRRVALKVLSPQLGEVADYRMRFEREARALARADSPHIVSIYGSGEIDGCMYIAAQFVAGGDLDQRIGEGMDPVSAVSVCAQVARGLEAAHQVGVLHRDVKPHNVLLRPGSPVHAYLCDFGIADLGDVSLTSAGMVAGTWGYLAPERCQGAPASPASDVYGLGCVLWNCLTGQTPYQGSAPQQALGHTSEPVRQLAGNDVATTGLNRVLARSMAKDPGDRYGSAAEFADALEALADALRHQPGTTARPDPLATAPTRSSPTPPLPGVPPSMPRPTPPPVVVNGRTTPEGAPGGQRGLVAVLALVAVLLAAAIGVGAWKLTRPDKEVSGSGSSAQPTSPSATTSAAPSGSPSPDQPTAPSGPSEPSDSGPGRLLIQGRDVDGDGHDDATIQLPGTVLAISVSSAGTPELLSSSALALPSTQVLRADFTGDGLTDLVAMNPDQGSLDVAVGSGSGFTEPSAWSAAVESPVKLTAADFTGDGLADLAVVTKAAGGGVDISVYVSTGDGFADPAVWARIPQWTWENMKVISGDFTGDGRADLAEMGRPARGGVDIRVFPSLGSTFAADQEWMANRSWDWAGTRLNVGDFDADGKTDLIALRDEGSGVTAYGLRSDGDTFADSYEMGRLAERGLNDLISAAADFDADGRTDVMVIPGSGPLSAQVFWSDGTGLNPASSEYVALPGFDADDAQGIGAAG